MPREADNSQELMVKSFVRQMFLNFSTVYKANGQEIYNI